jgi:predicted metal-dependent enzyme (double-stranded beta helix superfamily)
VGAAYLSTARETLRALLDQPELLSSLPRERAPGAYSRTLIFGDGEVSVWALTWPPGSSTCIHDHHCPCCFGVAAGSITETWFTQLGGDQVMAVSEEVRPPGFVAAMLPTGPNIHQMRNDGLSEAISIHIYGFNHETVENSIRRQYQRADGTGARDVHHGIRCGE